MSHSIIDTPDLGDGNNRYGPTVARTVSNVRVKYSTKTVDCHAHILIEAAARHVNDVHHPASQPFGKYASALTRLINKQQDQDRSVALLDPADRLKVLDAMGIDIQVVSPAPPQCYYDVPINYGRAAARLVNEGVAAYVACEPRRFVGLGTVPLQDPAAAADELEFAVSRLGLRGVQILTNVNGRELSDSVFDAVWERAEALGAVVMLHPLGFTEAQRFEQHYFTNVIGNPLDTTVALHHLIFGGVLERYPALKILAAHGGGFLPMYSGRIDHAWGARRDAREGVPKPPSTYLKRMFFDTTVFTPQQLEYLVTQYGADHVLMGTDYPYDMAEYYPLQHIDCTSLDDAQKRQVAGGSAIKLFGISTD